MNKEALLQRGAKASFYLVPQATDGISFTLTLGGETKHFTLDALFKQSGNPQAALERGKPCTLTLKVGRDGITVSAGSIGAWEDQATADGEVVIGRLMWAELDSGRFLINIRGQISLI